MNAPSVTQRLSCDGELRFEHQGQTLQLTANGSNLRLTAPSFALLRQAWRLLPLTPHDTAHALRHADLHLLVTVKHTEIARVGAGVEANWLGGLVGLPGTFISLQGILRALIA